MSRLVLIAHDLLIDDHGQPVESAVSQVVRLHRAGWQLVVLAPRPERWRPTRHSMDRAMNAQRHLHQALTRAGGDLDGVYYLEYGLFTWRRRRAAALDELAGRYGLKAADLVLIAQQKRVLELTIEMGGRALGVGIEAQLAGVERFSRLADAVEALNQ